VATATATATLVDDSPATAPEAAVVVEDVAPAPGPDAPALEEVEADAATAPFGEGSHAPLPDRSMPPGFPIKGNADSMLFHRPDSRSYSVTIAEVWFDTPERAEAAGFALSPTHPAASAERAEQAPPAPSAAPAGKGDDLSLIRGTDPYLVSQLRAKGITTFARVAALTDDDIADLEQSLGVPGRVVKYNWRLQARQLQGG
jgi:predicted flap endonuclease-1-like 5' DNA nuclease